MLVAPLDVLRSPVGAAGAGNVFVALLTVKVYVRSTLWSDALRNSTVAVPATQPAR